MKHRFLIYLLIVIGLTAAATAAIVGGYGHHRMRTFYETQQNELIEALKDRLIAFDRMIRLVERQMRTDAEAATRAISEILMPDGKIRTDLTDRDLADLLDPHGVTEISLVGPDGRINRSTDPDAVGLDLFALSTRFEQFLRSVYGRGEIKGLRISVSAQDGRLTLYTYYSPQESDRILNIAIDLEAYLRRNFGEDDGIQLADFLIDLSPPARLSYLEDIDLFIRTRRPDRFWSLTHPGTGLPADSELGRVLKDRDQAERVRGDRLVYFARFRLEDAGFDFANTVFVRAVLDRSPLRDFPRDTAAFALLICVAVATVAYLLSSRLFNAHILARLDRLNAALADIAEGKYDKEVAVGGDDDLTRMAGRIDRMRRRILSREAELRRYADALQCSRDALEIRVDQRTRAFQASESRYRALFDDSPIPLLEEDLSGVKAGIEALALTGENQAAAAAEALRRDPDALNRCIGSIRILNANKAALSFFGLSSPSSIGADLIRVTAGRSKPPEALIEQMAALSAGTRTFASHVRVTRADDRVRNAHVHLRVMPGHEQTLRRVLVSVVDITEQKHAESALRRALGQLRAIFETIPGLIYVIDTDYAIVDISQKLIDFFGLGDRGRVTGRTCYEVFKSRSAPCPECRAGETLGGGRSTQRFSTPEEETLTGMAMKIYTSAVHGDGNQVAGAVIYLLDISDLRRMERDLQAATAAAERASQAKSELLANMSHEIRTPMNAIIGMADILAETELSADQCRFTDIIRSSSAMLLALINDILDFSKIEAGKLGLEQIVFRPADLVDEVVEMLSPRAAEKGLALVREISPEVPSSLRGDPGRLRQILSNFVGNAVKFTEIGEIRIRATADPPDDDTDGIRLRVSVSDTGVGVPEDRLDEIFAPFSQADGSISRKYGGTGLGLAISRQLAELMGGTVSAESRPGVGSTFTFTAVLGRVGVHETAPDDSTSRPCRPPPSTPPPDTRILIVEDNPTNRTVALEILKRAGLSADTADSGPAAIARLKESDYDLVFMDVQMPEMDGLEATRRIRDPRTAVRNPSVPIIAMTAHAMKGDREACLAAGMNDYLSKPIDRPALLAAISRVTAGDETAPPADSASPEDTGSTAAGPALLDLTSLLRRLDHDAGLCREIIRVFLDDLPHRMADLRRVIRESDLAAIAAGAHTVKGAFANISSPRLQSLAADLESAARSAGPDGASEETASFSSLFMRLDRDFDALCAELTACLDTLDGEAAAQSGERSSI